MATTESLLSHFPVSEAKRDEPSLDHVDAINTEKYQAAIDADVAADFGATRSKDGKYLYCNFSRAAIAAGPACTITATGFVNAGGNKAFPSGRPRVFFAGIPEGEAVHAQFREQDARVGALALAFLQRHQPGISTADSVPMSAFPSKTEAGTVIFDSNVRIGVPIRPRQGQFTVTRLRPSGFTLYFNPNKPGRPPAVYVSWEADSITGGKEI